MHSYVERASIRARLILLVIVVAIPYSALLIWHQMQEEHNAREAVYTRMEAIAQASATGVDLYFQEQREVLTLLAKRPGVQSLDSGGCDPLLMLFPELHPEFTNLTLRRPDGTLVCSSLSGPLRAITPEFQKIVDNSIQTDSALVSGVIAGNTTQKQIVVTSMAVKPEAGSAPGVLLLGADLQKLNKVVFRDIPPAVTVAVFDRSETFVLRSTEPEKWIGQPIAPVNKGIYNREPMGRAVITAVDGVRRMYAWTTIPSLGWRVTAGIPEDLAMVSYIQARDRTLVANGALIVLALFLAFRLGGSIARPLGQLEQVARRIARDDMEVRADITGPGELRTLATQFNRMLDVRMESLQALSNSDLRWKFAIEGAGDGLWDWDVQAGTMFFSTRWKSMLGYSEAEVGNTLADCNDRVHPDDMPALMAALQPHLDGTAPSYSHEHRMRRKDGSYAWILDRGLVVSRDAQGKALRVVGTQSDVTQRKLEQEALRRSEAQYRELLNVSPVPCALNDNDQNIVFVNRAFTETFGYTQADIPNLAAWWPLAYPEPDYQEWVKSTWVKRLQAAFTTGTAFAPIELRIRCKDQSTRTVLANAAALSNPLGDVHLVVLVDITERKAMEDSMRSSEAHYRELLNVSPVPCALIDGDRNFVFVNRASIRTFGYTLEDTPTLDAWWSLAYPDATNRALMIDTWNQRFSGTSAPSIPSEPMERRVRCKDGNTRTTLLSVASVKTTAADMTLVVMVDITERKVVEEALRTSADLLEYSQAVAKVGGWELTLATGHLYWTAETYRLHDTTPEEFNPTVDAGVSFFLPESRERITTALGLAMEEGLGYALELQTHTTKGRLIDVFTTCTVSMQDGKPVKLTGIFQDITTQKAALRALTTSQMGLESVINYAMDAIINIDAAHKVTLFNPAAEKMFGYSAAQMLGQPLDRLIPARFAAAHDAHIEGFGAAAQRSRMMGRAGELKAVRASGEEFYIEPSISQTMIDGQRVFTVMMRDISERVQATRKVQEVNLELTRSNADLEQFAYVASHDLQEPLRSVSSSVQLLKRRYNDALDARANEFIAHAVGGVERMQTIINDLLAYSRISAGPRVARSAPLEGALEVALANLQRSLAASEAHVTHDPLPTLQANPQQMAQLFQNLIGNALKFRGDKPAVVHISAQDLGSEWRFAVADQGIGIEPAYFERIFKLFQRLHTRTEYEGTGIGLTICQKIVERHGGRIWVESVYGEGTTFFFTLPHMALQQ